jgi:hypothetical protein
MCRAPAVRRHSPVIQYRMVPYRKSAASVRGNSVMTLQYTYAYSVYMPAVVCRYTIGREKKMVGISALFVKAMYSDEKSAKPTLSCDEGGRGRGDFPRSSSAAQGQVACVGGGRGH